MVRPVEFKDLEWLRQQRNKEEIFQYFNQSHYITKEEQENWYHNVVVPHKNHVFIVYIDSIKIGYVALKDIDDRVRQAEFSIFIIPEYQGQSYGREALDFIVRFGFNNLNLHKIYSTVFSFNKAIDFYRKFGFTIDGLLRDNCFKDGTYFDSYYISLLDNEYNCLKSPISK